MKIDIWKDPETGKYYFAIKHHNDALLSAVMAEFHGPPDAIALLIEVIKTGSQIIENHEVDNETDL